MRDKPELLVPVGGLEQLRHALHFGADAVYLGGEHFGMRERADNFHGVDLAFAIALVHEQGKKAYVAVNTLVHQPDLGALRDYLLQLEEMGADAVIVSDLAAIDLIQEMNLSLEMHISTQASVVNARAARRYYEMGARRVVLARELTLPEIAAIREEVPADLELEAFVHGAMCIAYSGRCLISNYLVGRDANRGNCTQPCRWKWSLQEETRPGEYFPIEEDGAHTFILNSADMNMLSYVDDLHRAGIDSLKIEGRMKGAYYVATATNAYRQVIDGADPALYLEELDTFSHRPYHTGFYFGVPAQSYDGKEYVQTCDFIGSVDSCQKCEDGYRIRFALRNRLYAGDELEVLSPGCAVRTVKVVDLRDEESGWPVKEANHNAHYYTFTSETALSALDILRKRRNDPNVQAGH